MYYKIFLNNSFYLFYLFIFSFAYSKLKICQILATDLNFNSQLNVIDIVEIIELIISNE